MKFNLSSPRVCVAIMAVFISALFAGTPVSPQIEISSHQLELPDKAWVAKILPTLSLREKIAQLIQIRVSGNFANRESPGFKQISEQIRQDRIGGVVLFAGNIYESAVLLNELQTLSKLPLLVAADFESGVSFRISDTTSFPWAMALGATGSEEFAYRQGLITAQESRALGVHWIFAPVMDVNNNPDNPVINIRSFGEDPQLVARIGSAFIRGARRGGVLTTAKHFPGHGDTSTDSHLSLPSVPSDMTRLQSIELVPFRSAIEAGVDAIMTAHIALPQITGTSQIPATLSSQVLTDLLHESLNFRGLVVTDALEMSSVANNYWCGLAAIRAIQAGADILLLPPNAVVAINEIERAVIRGDISEDRIDESVKKVLFAKSSLGLQHRRSVSIDRIGDTVASPQSSKLAQEIADHSITVVHNERRLIPINPINNPKVLSLVLVSDLESFPASVFQREMRRRFPSIRTLWSNERISDELSASIDLAVSDSEIIVVSTLVRLTSGQNTTALPKNQRTLLNKLMASQKPLIWVSFGSPFLFHLAPRAGAYVCAFSYSDVSQVAAARALSGEIDVTGTLPVSIPGYFKVGDGVRIPKLEMILKTAKSDTADSPNQKFEKTKKRLLSLVADEVLSGAHLIVGHKSRILLDFAAGKFARSVGSNEASVDTPYDIGDLSKIVGITSAAMLAAESCGLNLRAPVQDYLPEFQGANKDRVLIQDLLNGSSGIPASLPSTERFLDYQSYFSAIYATPLVSKPGTKSEASNLDWILLEEIVSRASGLPLDRFLAMHLFNPLGMTSAFFEAPRNLQVPIAGGTDKERVPLPSGAAPFPRTFCRAQDLAVFAQMMLNGGIYDHRRYFSPETFARFTGSGKSSATVQSLGWSKRMKSNWTGKFLSSAAFGYGAANGTSLWIDPVKQLFIIFMASHTPSSTENRRIMDAQQLIHESVFDELVLRSDN